MDARLQDRWNDMTVAERSRLLAELLDSNAELCSYGGLSPELREILDRYANDEHINSALGIDDPLYVFPDNDDPAQCHGGENHEYDSRSQTVSYNSPADALRAGIHFADDDGTRSSTHDIMNMTYSCLRCRENITEVFSLEHTEFAGGPLEPCPNCLGDGMFKRCARCDGDRAGCVHCEVSGDDDMIEGKDCAMCLGTGVGPRIIRC